LILQLRTTFEEAAYEENGIEYWLARDLQDLLGYSDWRNFLNAVNKAKESCRNSQIEPDYHFVDVNKMIKLPKNASREVDDIIVYIQNFVHTNLRRTEIAIIS
jgi:DNA-damage-inducible protein D